MGGRGGGSRSAATSDCEGALGVGESRQGRPGIAHRFIGGNRRADAIESRQGRKTRMVEGRVLCRPWRDSFSNRLITQR
jgi:hypothetical protein